MTDLDAPLPVTALPPIQEHAPSISVHPLASDLPGLARAASSVDVTVAPDFLPASMNTNGHDAPGEGFRLGIVMEPELAEPRYHAGLSDQFFRPRVGVIRPSVTWPLAPQTLPLDPALLEGTPERDLALEPVEYRAPTAARSIAVNSRAPQRAYTSEFSTSEKHGRQKARARFTAHRRKEVQMVRKMGACIRCRMLKKPVRMIGSIRLPPLSSWYS